MNQDQVNSMVRSVLKLAGGALVAHGLTKVGSWLNTQDAAGLALAVVGLLWSHFYHASDGSATATTPAQKQP